MQKSFLYNSVRVKHVPWHGQDVHPETGIAFYVSSGQGGVIGVQVFPNGTKHQINATLACKHKDGTFHHDNQPRYHFRDAFGHHKVINVPRAIYTAWRGKPIPAGMTIDHIDGCATNNDYRNLRCVSGAINSRDGGFLRKLKKAGFEPGASSRQTGGAASAEKGIKIPRWILLRYFTRMAKFKAEHTPAEYKNLSKTDLTHILYDK